METINKSNKVYTIVVVLGILLATGLAVLYKAQAQPTLQPGYWYSVEGDEVIAYPKADFHMETLAQEIKRRWADLSQDNADEIAAYLKSDSYDAAIYANDECIQRNQDIIDTLLTENL